MRRLCGTFFLSLVALLKNQTHTLLKNQTHTCARLQVLFQDGKFQWKRLENLLALAREGNKGGAASASAALASTSSGASRAGSGALASSSSPGRGSSVVVAGMGSSGARGSGSTAGLDLSDTVKDALRVLLLDDKLRTQVRAERTRCACTRACVYHYGYAHAHAYHHARLARMHLPHIF